MTALRYVTTVEGIGADALTGGFFEGWDAPPSPEQHLQLMTNADHRVIALDGTRVVGFTNALSDAVLSAYIPLLEVLPRCRGAGVGTALIERLLDEIGPLYMIDVMCDAELMPFYERLGFHASTGGVRRNYGWRRTAGPRS